MRITIPSDITGLVAVHIEKDPEEDGGDLPLQQPVQQAHPFHHIKCLTEIHAAGVHRLVLPVEVVHGRGEAPAAHDTAGHLLVAELQFIS